MCDALLSDALKLTVRCRSARLREERAALAWEPVRLARLMLVALELVPCCERRAAREGE